jgi:hypothetical protein
MVVKLFVDYKQMQRLMLPLTYGLPQASPTGVSRAGLHGVDPRQVGAGFTLNVIGNVKRLLSMTEHNN